MSLAFSEDSEREGVSENYVKVAKTPEVSRRQSSYLRHSKAVVLGPKADQILCLLWKSKGCKKRRELAEKRDFFSAPQLPNPGPQNNNTSMITGKFQQRSQVSSVGCICGFTSFKCCKKRETGFPEINAQVTSTGTDEVSANKKVTTGNREEKL